MNETLSYQIQEPRKFKAGQVKGKKTILKKIMRKEQNTHTQKENIKVARPEIFDLFHLMAHIN